MMRRETNAGRGQTRMTGVWPEDERGATLVLMAVIIVALLGMAALAIDVGMGYTAKSEAQRIADSSALAGASAFLDYTAADAVTPAENRAYEYATMNYVRNVAVTEPEVSVQVVPDSTKVRVWVEREGIGTWFARILGFDELSVVGYAVAQATPAGAARCLKPFAMPDMWHDVDDDTDGDRVWDEGEEWELGSHPDDRYVPYTGEGGAADATGYGSDWRSDYDRDYGRQISIKAQDPNSEYVPEPSVFLPWRLPPDDDGETCDRGGGGGGPAGAATYRNNICTCNNYPVELGVEYDIEPGNMVGPTFQGIDELISEDPNAYWDPNANGGKGGVEGSDFEDGMNSPRVVKLAMFDPSEIDGSGMQSIRFNNFALFFIEEHASRRDPIIGRFLYYAPGEESPGPTTGSLVRYLRLIE